MKSLYEISWQVDESTYRADEAYSYSTISRFDREGFKGLPTLFDKISTPSLIFGSMVDTLLTDGEEAFNEKFAVVDFPKLSDSLINVTKRLFDEFPDSIKLSDIDDFDIARIGAECGYYAGKSYESTRVRNIRRDCGEYFDALVYSGGKEVVSTQDYMDCIASIDALRTSPATEFYFRGDEVDDIERQYQLKFKGEYEGIKLRTMMDLCVVNHRDKTITPCDLKTSSHFEYDFPLSFVQYRYFIQAQLYWEILRQNIIKDDYFKDFKINNYVFIVVNRNSRNPLVWEYKDTKAITNLTYGRKSEYICRNWREIVKEMDYYLKENPKTPIGISDTEPNDIINYLNNN